MSLDLNALVRAVKKAAVEAVRAENPMGVCHGTVTGISPLEITTDQKLILGEKQLILTNAVRDYTVEMTVDHVTEVISHGHPVTDTYTGGGTAQPVDHSHPYTWSPSPWKRNPATPISWTSSTTGCGV